jgi:lactoylglutathione lyase
MMLSFNHYNFNVSNLEASLAFYRDALGLTPVGKRKEAADGSFTIVFLGDGKTDFRLELTALRDHPQKYDLGECEFHLAMMADDFEAEHERHRKMGCICYENPSMGIYFIADPDGYWIEIIPNRK